MGKSCWTDNNWFRFYSDVNGKDGERIPVEEKALIVPEQKEFLFSEFDWCVAVKVHTVHDTHWSVVQYKAGVAVKLFPLYRQHSGGN